MHTEADETPHASEIFQFNKAADISQQYNLHSIFHNINGIRCNNNKFNRSRCKNIDIIGIAESNIMQREGEFLNNRITLRGQL